MNRNKDFMKTVVFFMYIKKLHENINFHVNNR